MKRILFLASLLISQITYSQAFPTENYRQNVNQFPASTFLDGFTRPMIATTTQTQSTTLSGAGVTVTLGFARSITVGYYVSQVRIRSTKNVRYWVYPPMSSTLSIGSSNYIEVDVPANTEVNIDMPFVYRASAVLVPSLRIINFYTDNTFTTTIDCGTTSQTVTTRVQYIAQTIQGNDYDFGATGNVIWIGDSITDGSGIASQDSTYQWMIREAFRGYIPATGALTTLPTQKYRYRHISYGFVSRTAADIAPLFKEGRFDNDKAVAYFICFGVNDVSQGRTSTQYVADLKVIIDYLLGSTKSNVPIIIITPTPIQNSTNQATARTFYTAANTAYGNPTYNSRVYVIDPGTAFTPATWSYYYQGDNLGVHPNGTGGLSIANVIISAINSQSIKFPTRN